MGEIVGDNGDWLEVQPTTAAPPSCICNSGTGGALSCPVHGPIERDLDGRRRLSLGRIGNPEHKRYRVEERGDGSIVLRPVVSVLLSNNTSEWLGDPGPNGSSHG